MASRMDRSNFLACEIGTRGMDVTLGQLPVAFHLGTVLFRSRLNWPQYVSICCASRRGGSRRYAINASPAFYDPGKATCRSEVIRETKGWPPNWHP
jgi:hypothetical protein